MAGQVEVRQDLQTKRGQKEKEEDSENCEKTHTKTGDFNFPNSKRQFK